MQKSTVPFLCFIYIIFCFSVSAFVFVYFLFPVFCVCVTVSFVIWSRRMSMLILSHCLTRPEHMWIFNWRVNFLSSIENEIEWVRSFHTYLAWIKCSSNVHTAGIHSMIDVGWHTWIAYTKRTETTSFRGKYRLLKKNKLLCGWLNSILFRLCHFTPHFGCCVWSDRSSLSSARRILCGDGVFVCGLCAYSVYCLFLTMFRLFFPPTFEQKANLLNVSMLRFANPFCLLCVVGLQYDEIWLRCSFVLLIAFKIVESVQTWAIFFFCCQFLLPMSHNT